MKRRIGLMLGIALMLFTFMLPGCAASEERIVLTIGDPDDRSANRYDGENQLGVWQELEEKLGVEIRYVHLTPETYASALASGDLPDIVATNNNLSAILDAGAALNVEPYLEEYVPHFLQGAARLTHDVFRQLLNDGDGFYFFPCGIGYNGIGFSNTPGNRGYAVRWDYYKELGCPPVNNEDDYLDVLKRMYEKHPFTEEGYPTYLFGTDNLSGYDTAFRSELSLDYWAAYKYQNNIFTNEIYDGYTDPAHSMWWASAAWHNKLWRAGKENGSYDLEIFTQTREEYDAKRARGQYLGLHDAKQELYNAKRQDDPETVSGYCLIPTSATNLYTNVYQLMGNGSAYMWFISAGSPHREAALKLFDCMCDPDFLREIAMGRKGVTWDYGEDGVPRMTEFGKEQIDAYYNGTAEADNYYVRWGGYSSLPNNWPLLRRNMTHPDGYPLDFYTQSREYYKATMNNNVARDICAYYDVELPTDAFYKAGGLDFRNDCGEAISSCISSLNRDQLRILADADAALDAVLVDLILAETDEKFNAIRDEAIARVTELGEPEVFEAYRQKWNAAAAVIVPLVREAQIRNGVEPYPPEVYEDRGEEGYADRVDR